MEVKLAFFFFFFFFISCIFHHASAQLRLGFYNSSCPRAETIVQQAVLARFKTDPSITAALLRMHFHDCFVMGCDASILIDSTKKKSAEKDALPNQTVRGYDLIDQAKQSLEAACPSTVSCADIITLATRDAVSLSGGPKYNVLTGRRDGLVSNSSQVIDLPGPHLSISDALTFFTSKGFTLNDMVVLLGAHTVGVAHCDFFQERLFNFHGTGKPDPTMDPILATTLLKTCGTQSRPLKSDRTVFLDQNTSFVLDREYYNQIRGKKGVLQIDQELALDSLSSILAGRLGGDENFFRTSFANAMIKMGNVGVLVGNTNTNGEIRKNCRVFNKRA